MSEQLFTNDDLKQGVVVIFHGNCADGFTAAWILEKHFRELEEHQDLVVSRQYVSGVYGENPDTDIDGEPVDLVDKTVFIVDFSFSESKLKEIAVVSHRLVIFDHHKSAREAIESVILSDIYENAVGIFDLDRSGAGITWDAIYPDLPRPVMVMHVEDRDLWKFEHGNTKAFQQNLFSYPYTFSNWFDIFEETESDRETYAAFVTGGMAQMRKHTKDIEEIVPQAAHRCILDNTIGRCANLPYFYASEAGHLMSKTAAYAACYWVNSNGEAIVSLRSNPDNPHHVDVSEIAKVYGGGGHKHAAGFRMPVDQFLLMITEHNETDHTKWVRKQFSDLAETGANTGSRLFINNNLLLTAVGQLQAVIAELSDSTEHSRLVEVTQDVVRQINDTLDYADETYGEDADVDEVETETLEGRDQ